MEREEVMDLEKLEDLPNEILIEILSNMEPKSLVKICSQSRKIRSLCEYAWRDLFRRDVTKGQICQNTNWAKFYRLAMTEYIPVLGLQFENRRGVVETIKEVQLGFPNIKWKIGNYLEKNFALSEQYIKGILMELDENDIEFETAMGKFIIIELGRIPMRDILVQLAKKHEKMYSIPLYSYSLYIEKKRIKRETPDIYQEDLRYAYMRRKEEVKRFEPGGLLPHEFSRFKDVGKNLILGGDELIKWRLRKLLKDKYNATELEISRSIRTYDMVKFNTPVYARGMLLRFFTRRIDDISVKQVMNLRSYICKMK